MPRNWMFANRIFVLNSTPMISRTKPADHKKMASNKPPKTFVATSLRNGYIKKHKTIVIIEEAIKGSVYGVYANDILVITLLPFVSFDGLENFQEYLGLFAQLTSQSIASLML